MIVVFEGCAGVGKSTILRAVANKFGFVSYKSFKEPNGVTRVHDASLIEKHIPMNTWREDVYVMDFLYYTGELVRGVILDRSLVSALAYESDVSEFDKMRMMEWWASRMKVRGLILNVRAANEKAAARNKHGHAEPFIRWEFSEMERWLCIAQSFGAQVVNIDNDGAVEVAIKSASDAITGWKREHTGGRQ